MVKFEIEPTIFFVRDGKLLKQVVNAQIEAGSGKRPAQIKVEMEGTTLDINLPRMTPGKGTYPLKIPEIRKPTVARFTLNMNGNRYQYRATLKPQKKWLLFLAQSVHTDIGYTHLQPITFRMHNKNLDKIINYCNETSGWPQGSQFKWNCECTWQIENYIKNRPPRKVKELMELVRRGRIEVGGLYLNVLTELCSHEELVRLVYYAERLRKEYGIQIRSAIATDTPGYTWALPTILSNSGIKYMSVGTNDFWGPFHKNTNLRTPFYWTGPDGSKILVWVMLLYALGEVLGFNDSYDRVHASLPGFITNFYPGFVNRFWGDDDYPFDAVLLHGSHGDNYWPSFRLENRASRIVREWNERWAFPRIRIATNSEFFEYIESKYATEIPEVRGDWGSFWADQAVSSAYETGVNRDTHGVISEAEKYSSLAHSLRPGYEYPAEEIQDAYKQMTLYDEHTWGATFSIKEPESVETKGQWAVKSGYAYRASLVSSCILKDSLGAIASCIKTGSKPTLAVFNSMSWQRTDIVEAVVPKGIIKGKDGFEVVDSVTGDIIPHQITGRSEKDEKLSFAFVARDVPALGYRTYHLQPGGRSAATNRTVSSSRRSMENKFYRLSFDSVTGAIDSIYDKELGRELVDRASRYKVNQYIYYEGVPKSRFRLPEWLSAPYLPDLRGPRHFRRASPTSAIMNLRDAGPVMASAVVRTRGRKCPRIEQEVILYRDIKRIDIIDRLTKEETLDKEAIYYSFPFQVDGGEFRCELPDAIMRPEREQISGASRDWYAVQHWVDVSNADYGVTWAPRQAHLVELCEMNSGRWMRKLDVTNATLFSRVASNYWVTACRASQGGSLAFGYSITSHKGPASNVQATQFGWAYSNPLRALLLQEDVPGQLPGARFSFCQVTPGNVIVLAIKRAEDAKGIIIRLLEVEGKSTTVRVRLPYPANPRAHLTNLVEENLKALTVSRGTVIVPTYGFGLATVRIVSD